MVRVEGHVHVKCLILPFVRIDETQLMNFHLSMPALVAVQKTLTGRFKQHLCNCAGSLMNIYHNLNIFTEHSSQ